MSAGEATEVIGYLLGAFGLGYCVGYILYIFRRATDFV